MLLKSKNMRVSRLICRFRIDLFLKNEFYFINMLQKKLKLMETHRLFCNYPSFITIWINYKFIFLIFWLFWKPLWCVFWYDFIFDISNFFNIIQNGVLSRAILFVIIGKNAGSMRKYLLGNGWSVPNK